MVNLAATDDEWQTDDETGYENPYDYDPNVVAENDPTVDGDDPSLDPDEDTEEIAEDVELEDVEADEEDGELAEIEPMYPSYEAWVEGWFTQVIRRKMGPSGGETVWPGTRGGGCTPKSPAGSKPSGTRGKKPEPPTKHRQCRDGGSTTSNHMYG